VRSRGYLQKEAMSSANNENGFAWAGPFFLRPQPLVV